MAAGLKAAAARTSDSAKSPRERCQARLLKAVMPAFAEAFPTEIEIETEARIIADSVACLAANMVATVVGNFTSDANRAAAIEEIARHVGRGAERALNVAEETGATVEARFSNAGSA
jgi:hypothetical protein